MLDGIVKIRLTVFKISLLFVSCFLSNLSDVQLLLWLFCEDKL